ncbi:unnamed protein product [Paramecium sonneborni]|nr:unnamed protein product [Paramecium sonneborni]
MRQDFRINRTKVHSIKREKDRDRLFQIFFKRTKLLRFLYRIILNFLFYQMFQIKNSDYRQSFQDSFSFKICQTNHQELIIFMNLSKNPNLFINLAVPQIFLILLRQRHFLLIQEIVPLQEIVPFILRANSQEYFFILIKFEVIIKEQQEFLIMSLLSLKQRCLFIIIIPQKSLVINDLITHPKNSQKIRIDRNFQTILQIRNLIKSVFKNN